MRLSSLLLKLPTRMILVPLLVLLAAGQALPVLAKDILATEKKLYSQKQEELIIRDFFQDRRDGFFLDVGCSTPVDNSTTYYLEKHLGWSGIGIDAQSELAGPWKEHRPNSKFFTFLVTDHSDTEDPFYVVPGAKGLSSIEKERQFMGKTIKGAERRVPSITLNELLERNKVSKVDFVSMDIEGAELLALKGFDIQRYKPELLCIEAWRDNHKQLLDYFFLNGYMRIGKYMKHDVANWYFTPKPQPQPKE